MTTLEEPAAYQSGMRQEIKNALSDAICHFDEEATDQHIARCYVNAAAIDDIREIASWSIADLVWEIRRERQREAEERAFKRNLYKIYNVSSDDELEIAAQKLRDRGDAEDRAREEKRKTEDAENKQAYRKCLFENLRSNLVEFYREKGVESRRSRSWRDHPQRFGDLYSVYMTLENPNAGAIVQEFKATSGFKQWLKRAHKLINSSDLDDKAKELFREEWHADGRRGRINERHYARMRQITEEYKQAIRLEVTEELLESQFALGDGVRVTWGEATADQHTKRIDMLTKNAVANAETASRHLAALDMLQAAGVTCLNEVTQTTPED